MSGEFHSKNLTDEEELLVEPTPLRPAVENQLELRRASYPDAEFVLDGEIPDVDVSGNELLESVLKNLLNNAVQHNDKDEPVVTLSFDVDEENVVVRVADNGPGIPDERKDSIFGKGEKGLDSPGTGIGLYLVRTVVDEYGGDVWVEDNDPEGAIFNVRLSRAEQAR
ncbi:MAG: sensor histidine kinase [Halobacterium sp.]